MSLEGGMGASTRDGDSEALCGWPLLKKQAADRDPNVRSEAIRLATEWLQNALIAVGEIDGSASPDSIPVDDYVDGGPSPLIPRTYRTLPRLGPTSRPPEPAEAVQAVRNSFVAWSDCRRRYVKRRRALSLARVLRQHGRVRLVALFGSMARRDPAPHDIDLLVLDDGTFSAELPFDDRQYGSAATQTRRALDVLLRPSEGLKAAAASGWVHVLLYDGDRLGRDPQYTRAMASAHSDPKFFLNIALDLQEFDQQSDQFVELTDEALLGLRRHAQQLKALGFV